MSSSNKPIYFPGLNGLRALAALSVVVFHLTRNFAEFNLSPFIFGTLADGTPKGFAMAGFGVTIFFCLSGFLITYLLLAEKKQQEINIKNFYLRRILRIWPLYYLYLIAVLIIIFYFGMRFNGTVLLSYIFFAANVPFILENIPHIAETTLPFLRHYWSLGVEEQYYLFWPWVVKKIKRRLAFFVIAFIVIFIALKCFFHFFFMHSIVAASFNVIRFDCMLIGSLGAIYYYNGHALFLKIFGSKIAQAAGWLVVLLLLTNVFHIASVIDHEIVSVVTVALIIGQITVKNRLVNLDIKICDFLGKISYGMYVIHPLVIFFSVMLLKDIALPPVLKYAVVYSFVTGVTIIVSWLSYQYLEKPFLKIKMRFTTVASSNTRTS
ncbi:acyltransferase family protein [Ferruginibacter sp.]|nr:acyltransferase [Ferruginibacter sp.]